MLLFKNLEGCPPACASRHVWLQPTSCCGKLVVYAVANIAGLMLQQVWLGKHDMIIAIKTSLPQTSDTFYCHKLSWCLCWLLQVDVLRQDPEWRWMSSEEILDVDTKLQLGKQNMNTAIKILATPTNNSCWCHKLLSLPQVCDSFWFDKFSKCLSHLLKVDVLGGGFGCWDQAAARQTGHYHSHQAPSTPTCRHLLVS